MKPILLKCAFIALALVIWFRTQKLIGAKAGGNRLADGVHRATFRAYRYLRKHPRVADRALLVSSLFIDALGISLFLLALLGPTLAPFLGIVIVFSLRQICQMCCTVPPPRGMIWRDPGFPSILVTYDVGNDMFFSGHTALAVLGAIEICHAAPSGLGALAVLVALGEVIVVLLLRAHYTMDVIAGAFAAWFASDIAHRIAPAVDRWLAGM